LGIVEEREKDKSLSICTRTIGISLLFCDAMTMLAGSGSEMEGD
jgi:hypothetical protein